MKKIHTPSQIIQKIAEHYGMMHPNGKVNYSAIADRAGLAQATVSRIHRGVQPNRDLGAEEAKGMWSLNSRTIEALMRGFRLTYRQAAGLEPLPWETRRSALAVVEDLFSFSELEMITRFRQLPLSAQDEISTLVRLKAELDNQRSCE